MEISTTVWTPDITEYWRQQQETHFKYADLTDVARDIFSIIPHGVWLEASFSLGQDVIGWKQSQTTGETLRENVIVRQFPWAYNWILAGDDQALYMKNTENELEMKWEVEERKLHRMANVHNHLEMLQHCKHLHATPEESHTQQKQLTAIGYISDTEEIVKACCALFQPDEVGAFKLSERSPLAPALSAKDLPGGHTEVLNFQEVGRKDRHSVESDVDSTPESISDTEDWLNCHGDLVNPTDSEDNCKADVESHIKLDNDIEDLQGQEQQDVSATPNLPGLIRPTWKSQCKADKGLVMFNAMETRRHKGVKKKYDKMHQSVSPVSLCSLNQSFIQRYSMGEWWAVACQYLFINRCIEGT